MAVLTVTREKKMFGFAIKVKVSVGDEELGKLKPGESVTKELKPGTYTVHLKTPETVVDQEIEIKDSTKTVDVSFKLKMGLVTGAPKVVEVKYN